MSPVVRRYDTIANPNKSSEDAYEKHARTFLELRDNSKVGVQVIHRWAQSLPSCSEVIEIACGGGFPVTQTLSDAGLRVWAIDSSPTLLDVFKARFPNIPTQCATVLKSDFFQRDYDAAISIGLIFLLTECDQLMMLERISKLLRPGASFLFTAPIEIGTWTDLNTGHRCLSLGQDRYETALMQAGFSLSGCYEDRGKNNYYDVKKVGLPVKNNDI